MIILIILADLCSMRISGLGLLTRGLGLGKLSLSPLSSLGIGMGWALSEPRSGGLRYMVSFFQLWLPKGRIFIYEPFWVLIC